MFMQLISLSKTEDCETEIILDDIFAGSQAVYMLQNPNRLSVLYCKPDEKKSAEPRCDYLLVVPATKRVKFIELKGIDARNTDCAYCRSTWDHGFHQLEATYKHYENLLEADDRVEIILCTILPRCRIGSRYANYKRYRKLMEITGGNTHILCADEWDNLL